MRSRETSRRYSMIGQQLKSARRKINLHPSVIASTLGYTDPSIVFSIENGEVRVPLEEIPKLATTLKMPLYRLQMIVEGYYPGFSSKAREIVSRSIGPCPEDKIAVAIVLAAIDRQAKLH